MPSWIDGMVKEWVGEGRCFAMTWPESCRLKQISQMGVCVSLDITEQKKVNA